MADVPLGFGVTARSTQDCRKVPATDVIVFHQVHAIAHTLAIIESPD